MYVINSSGTPTPRKKPLGILPYELILSSLLVGALWSAFGVDAAFGVSAVLFAAGAVLILRLK